MIWLLLVPLLVSLALVTLGVRLVWESGSVSSDWLFFCFIGVLMAVAGMLSAASLAAVLWKFH